MLQNRLDSIGATILPIVYLIANIGATGYYFSDSSLAYVTLVGYLIAGAIELHAFLAQRRARRAWKERAKGTPSDFAAHLAIMCVLVAFQCFTNIGYLLATWHAPFYAIIIRGVSVPMLFLLTGILIPLAVDAADILVKHHARMLMKTAQATAKQHDRRVDSLAKANANLSPVLAALWRYHGNEKEAGLVEAMDTALANVERATDGPSAGYVTSRPTAGLWSVAPDDQSERLSEPAAKRQIRRLLEEDDTLSVAELVERTGLAQSTCSVYRLQLLKEWGKEIRKIAVSA